MKLTTKKTVEEELEITLPYFTKTICHYYKVYSDTHCICVTNLAGYNSITIHQSSLAFGGNYEVCTEQEFLDMFNKVNSELCQLATV
jgi:hypothetical protein